MRTWRPVLGGDDALKDMDSVRVRLVNGIGQLVGNQMRREL